MLPITSRQKQILQFVQSYREDKGYSPSVRNIAERFDITPRAAHEHLQRLERQGALRFIRPGPGEPRSRRMARGLQLRESLIKIPILGRVPAGQPFHVEENVEGYIEPEEVLPKSPQHFALRVKGDSMTGAGILDGDIVIVRRQETAQNGDLVVALIEDEATVKKYVRTERGAELKPANPRYQPIPLVGQVHLAGKVVRVLRKCL